MKRTANLLPALSKRDGIIAGLTIAALWGFHAAAAALPGRAYFFATKLNDSMAPVGLNLFLHPAFLLAVVAVGLRGTSMWRKAPTSHKYGLTAALGCWFLSATLSAVAHFGTDEVLVTYCTVFLAGAAVYVALQGLTLDSRAFEIALVGLAVGSLFPLIGGITAFVQEWGTLDVDTALGAYKNLLRMQLYETATFGSRGNTASFLVIVMPVFLWIALDRSRSRIVRTISGLVLVPVFTNLLILEIRAAFLACFFSLATVFGFKLGVRRYPLFAVGVALSLLFMSNYMPDVMDTMSDRLRPVVTVDTAEDVSVSERADAINEGWVLAKKNLALGIGPGAGLTLHSQGSAHQFNVEQFMEDGIVGLLASVVFSAAVLALLLRTLARGQDDGVNNVRFALVIGPASFVVYGIFSNPTLALGYVNTWAVLVASMLALAPGFELRKQRAALVQRAAAPRISSAAA